MALQRKTFGYSQHLLEIDVDGRRAFLQCYWKLNGQLRPTEAPTGTKNERRAPFRTLDLLLTGVPTLPQNMVPERLKHIPDCASGRKPKGGQSEASLFVQDAIKRHIDQYSSSITALKLLLPTVDGYAFRNDIIQRRFLTCDLAEKAADFTTLRHQIRAFEFSKENVLQRALSGAIGAILLKRLPGINRALAESAIFLLEAEVRSRLSFTWIIDRPLPRKRLAMVEGRPNPAVSTASLGIYRAAQALGIDLVILDHDGHWVQDPAMGSMRDEFIVCDLTLDEGLPDRIIESVSKSKGPIDAIITYTDSHLLATAIAAKKMGLHTNQPEALEMCRDKQKTRQLASTDVRVLLITGVADLKQLPRLASPLQYPLIVKPITGCASEGVSKVTCEEELIDAIRRNEEKFPGVNSLIEPYISGPEVDANFVLLDGQLIWSEINDDFPSSAEIPQNANVSGDSLSSSTSSKSFAELSTIIPSILPNSEVSLLKSSLAETLLKLGFRNGVYHLEARVKDSRKNYIMTDDGMELVDSQLRAGKTPDPSIFLIEINARIPGHQESFAVEYTYGIDYFAVFMLMALLPVASATQTADDATIKYIIHGLCQPLPAHIQYPTNIVFIPAEHGGTFVAAEPLPESLMDHVPVFTVFMQKGEEIKDPEIEGKWPFLAYFLVVARLNGTEGREQVRRIGEIIRKTFRYEIQN